MIEAVPTTAAESIRPLAERARAAYAALAASSLAERNIALLTTARRIRTRAEDILLANAQDIAFGTQRGLSPAMLDRLKLTPERLEGIATGAEAIAAQPDPLHRVLAAWERPNGLHFERISVPLGVIGVIYEARPNVTVDAAALCLKSGNAVILRGGSESLHSSTILAECVREGLREAGLPEDAVQLIPTRDRAAVTELLGLSDLVDVIIPRGGKGLTQKIQEESRIPTILHLDGNCHVYVHTQADLAMAVEVVVNAKMRRTGICGATESLLIDREIAPILFPAIAVGLRELGCEIRGDATLQTLDASISLATEEDWGTEYLAPIISAKTVSGVDEAIAHINRYGSHHTDAIITADTTTATRFFAGVDSAIVLHNASTQFADGGEFGFGGEIGISTGRLHARGPVGCEQLTTYKYVVRGNGTIRPL